MMVRKHISNKCPKVGGQMKTERKGSLAHLIKLFFNGIFNLILVDELFFFKN